MSKPDNLLEARAATALLRGTLSREAEKLSRTITGRIIELHGAESGTTAKWRAEQWALACDEAESLKELLSKASLVQVVRDALSSRAGSGGAGAPA